MGMYNGPYLFEYVGAFIRWLLLIFLSEEKRRQQGLFKRILTGNNSMVERSAKTFFTNFVVGLLFILLMVIAFFCVSYIF